MRKGICTAFHVMLGMPIVVIWLIPTKFPHKEECQSIHVGCWGGGGKNPFMYEIFQEITNQSLNIMTYGKGECRNPFMHDIF